MDTGQGRAKGDLALCPHWKSSAEGTCLFRQLCAMFKSTAVITQLLCMCQAASW